MRRDFHDYVKIAEAGLVFAGFSAADDFIICPLSIPGKIFISIFLAPLALPPPSQERHILFGVWPVPRHFRKPSPGKNFQKGVAGFANLAAAVTGSAFLRSRLCRALAAAFFAVNKGFNSDISLSAPKRLLQSQFHGYFHVRAAPISAPFFALRQVLQKSVKKSPRLEESNPSPPKSNEKPPKPGPPENQIRRGWLEKRGRNGRIGRAFPVGKNLVRFVYFLEFLIVAAGFVGWC